MSPEATELTLYLDNEEPLYRQKIVIFRALAKKKDRGKYNHALAPKAFASLMGVAAKKYVREFGAPGDRWNHHLLTHRPTPGRRPLRRRIP